MLAESDFKTTLAESEFKTSEEDEECELKTFKTFLSALVATVKMA